ncbi:MAG TPA: NYN domain-containing protein [Planctomycetota bacterium]|nr:NYN domain-containing protein [Planctomycetota bacterium]
MLILDGHNVLFAMAAGGPLAGAEALEAAQARLEDGLIRHHSATGETATVVYDSRQLRGGARGGRNLPGVRILYAHPPETADDEIRRLVAARTAPQRLRVVSSDREVMRACSARGAEVVHSGAFLRELRFEAERYADAEAERRQKTARPSPDEVAELLAAFGEPAPETRLIGPIQKLRRGPRPRR